MSGVVLSLGAALGAQILAGVPMAIPVTAVQWPSVRLYTSCLKGTGMYIGSTVLSVVLLVFGASVWEITSLSSMRAQTDHKAMMVSIQLSRAELTACLCVTNFALAVFLVRLADEISRHARLQKSHSALQRQAAGLSKEYERATAASASTTSKPSGATTEAAEDTAELKVKLTEAQSAKAAAEKELRDVRMQATNLEKAYDELRRQNMKAADTPAGGSTGGPPAWAFPSRKKAD